MGIYKTVDSYSTSKYKESNLVKSFQDENIPLDPDPSWVLTKGVSFSSSFQPRLSRGHKYPNQRQGA